MNGQAFMLGTSLFRLENLEDSEEEDIKFHAQNLLNPCTRRTKTHYTPTRIEAKLLR